MVGDNSLAVDHSDKTFKKQEVSLNYIAILPYIIIRCLRTIYPDSSNNCICTTTAIELPPHSQVCTSQGIPHNLTAPILLPDLLATLQGFLETHCFRFLLLTI